MSAHRTDTGGLVLDIAVAEATPQARLADIRRRERELDRLSEGMTLCVFTHYLGDGQGHVEVRASICTETVALVRVCRVWASGRRPTTLYWDSANLCWETVTVPIGTRRDLIVHARFATDDAIAKWDDLSMSGPEWMPTEEM